MAPTEQDRSDSSLAWDDLRVFFLRQGWLILAVTLLLVLGTYVIVEVMMTELYEARASILVKLGRENVELPATVHKGGVLTTGVRKEDLNSEIQMVRSPALIERVIDEIGLEAFSPPPPPPRTLFQAVKGALKRALQWVKGAVNRFLILANLKKELGLRERVILAVEGALAVVPERDADVISIGLRLPDPDLAVGVLERLLHHYRDYRVQVRENVDVKPFFDAKVDELMQRLVAIERARKEAAENGNLGSITEQRNLLLRRRHELVGLLLKQRDDLNRQLDTTESEISMLHRQRTVLRERLDSLAEEIQSSRVLAANPSLLPIKERLAAVRVERSRQLTRFTADSEVIRNIDQEIATLERLLADEDATHTASTTMQASTVKQWFTQTLEQLQVQLGGLEARRAELRSQVARLDQEISVIGASATASPSAAATSLAGHLTAAAPPDRRDAARDAMPPAPATRTKTLLAEVSQIDADLKALDAGERALEAIDRERRIAEDSYTTYVKRREEARVSEELDRSRISNISVLSPPTRPIQPVSPRKFRLMGVGLAAGLTLGTALALARQYLTDTVRDAADVDRAGGLPYLGTLRIERS